MALAMPGRETRLLLITILVSVVMLLVLARFRFPEQSAPLAEPAPAPLERLAARATYDELTSILRDLDRRIAGTVVAVRATPDKAGLGSMQPAIIAAVRVSGNRAVALLGTGRHVDTFLPNVPATVLALDGPRGLALLGNPPSAGMPADWETPPPSILAPGYLAAVEGTRAGPAIRPLYFGRVDAVSDPRWPQPLLRFSALQQALPAGAAVFTLQGDFIGIGLPDERDLLVVPAAALKQEAERLAVSGSIPLADLGIEVQSLDRDVAAATRVQTGVVVTYVLPTGPAAGVLAIGDVITAVGDATIGSLDEYTAAALKLRPAEAVSLERVRATASATVQITPVARGEAPSANAPPLGLDIRPAPGGGSEVVRVLPRSLAARAGVLPGDVITMTGGVANPTPAVLQRSFDQLKSGEYLLMALERGPSHRVLAIAKP